MLVITMYFIKWSKRVLLLQLKIFSILNYVWPIVNPNKYLFYLFCYYGKKLIHFWVLLDNYFKY